MQVIMPTEKFPLLKEDVAALCDEDKDELLSRLNADTKTICLSFGSLVARTELCLQGANIPTRNLITFFRQCEMEELASSISLEDDIPIILDKVKKGKYWSFFNYELLEKMILTYCKEESVAAGLNQYISEFKVFCQRRVSEVSEAALKSDVNPKSKSVFKVKMDDTFSISQSNLALIKHVQQRIAKVLNKKSVLLKDIKDGCIELTFEHYDISEPIFPTTEEASDGLAKIGVQWLQCGKNKLKLNIEQEVHHRHHQFFTNNCK